MPTQPPRLADRFLEWFCASHLLEEVQGDLHERFQRDVKLFGEPFARRRYFWCVLAFFRPFALKNKKQNDYSTPLLSIDMIRNYFKIAWRNLLKNKSYSAINIGGLAMGMAVAMLIGLWVYDELSYNKYHKNYDRIAQLMQNQVVNGEVDVNTSVPFPFVNELKSNYSEHFKHIVPVTHPGEHIITTGENTFSLTGQFVGKEAPEMFTLKMLKGSWDGLSDQQSVLLSASAAATLFGEENPLNKSLEIDKNQVKVTGVYEDIPQNSFLHNVSFLSSWDYFLAMNPYMSKKLWDNHALWMYAEIKPGTDFKKVSAAIKDSELNVIRNMDNMKEEAATNPQMWLNPMSDWHLYSDFKNGIPDRGPVQYIWLVGLIGFFVLLLACINFMNLSTARSEKRAKEVGIRKAVGSLRSQLISQFFSESFLVVFLAFIISIVLVTASLTWFNNLAAKQTTIPWSNMYFWIFNLSFILITGLLAGSYPAFYLTSFQPVKVLKGNTVQLGRFASMPRKVLVAMQFTVSITLVICTAIVYSQVQFAKNRPVGYSRNGLMMIEIKSADFAAKSELLRAELKNTGVVLETALSQSPATGVWSANEGFKWQGNQQGKDRFATLTVSPEYAKTVGWEFVAGRNFSKELASDSSGFVINETAASLMGLKYPVGETVNWKSKWMTGDIQKPFKIIGVVKDMVMESPFAEIKPTVFFMYGDPNWLNVKLNPEVSAAVAVPKIGEVFKKVLPAVPFDYKFADVEYAAKFKAEERIGKLSGFFASLAILISCLGLFGLASFVAEQRTKEIGIRKILGASVMNLWQMLSRDFMALVLISSIISTPIAWYAMQNWLAGYDYHTEISWLIFVVTAAGALVITLLTVSYQAIKAALMNPVKTLKSE
ncbi:FtsX-like permease family protein [Emticicia sp. CRIBPO]|uniref:ABC transporter permease n=1 Tax=Emticicia sp. CRIBPO TaxID=2683258 RepID=UPI001412662B|nr:ABC transporter permease [Emticicia sp. CRIBPO]NBA87905.1 FtsX-like permease family protein [Emticicia sp. CRIBPO]